MPIYGGYLGKAIIVDLSGQTVSEYPWGNDERERYLGGRIMNQRIMLDMLSGGETAFSGENPIIISTGPLTGTGAPGSLRFDLASLSPKDDRPAFSNCGGEFGRHLKRAGYDALILVGRCPDKTWLEIREDRVLFHDAKDLWGCGTGECLNRLGAGKAGKLCIGPAGENLVKLASVVAGGHTAGRAGIGAVLGWKNLKAITVTGNREMPVKDPEKAASLNREWYAFLNNRGQPDDGKNHCTGCPLRCFRHERGGNPRLNELGMDAIAAEEAVAWTLEHGYAASDLYEDIAYRRGIGDKLAEGTIRSKGKGGKRRGGNDQAIAEAFRLPPDDPETRVFCRALTEAISAAGQCMFVTGAQTGSVLHTAQMLTAVTGMEMDLDRMLEIGRRSLELDRVIRERFG